VADSITHSLVNSLEVYRLIISLLFLCCLLQSSRDKSSKACTRRIVHMLKNPETVQNVNLYLCEAQTDKVCIIIELLSRLLLLLLLLPWQPFRQCRTRVELMLLARTLTCRALRLLLYAVWQQVDRTRKRIEGRLGETVSRMM